MAGQNKKDKKYFRPKEIQPKEGNIFYFYYKEIKEDKFAVNLQRKQRHYPLPTCCSVILTTQKTDILYPGDYLLPKEEARQENGKPVKAIADQVIPIKKSNIKKIKGMVSKKTLKEIRKRVADSLGIKYDDIA